MAFPYTYIDSAEYINNLLFDHIETYSLLRGSVFENWAKEHKEQGTSAKQNYILDEHGQFHPTSVKTHTFNKVSPEAQLLISILQSKAINIPGWMCAPLYRDAIVFYNKEGNIVSTLSICLDCGYMETKMYAHVNADNKVYNQLRSFFVSLDHNIEEPGKIW